MGMCKCVRPSCRTGEHSIRNNQKQRPLTKDSFRQFNHGGTGSPVAEIGQKGGEQFKKKRGAQDGGMTAQQPPLARRIQRPGFADPEAIVRAYEKVSLANRCEDGGLLGYKLRDMSSEASQGEAWG